MPSGRMNFKNQNRDTESKMDDQVSGGMHFAGYYVIKQYLHAGFFFSYIGGQHKIQSWLIGSQANTLHEFGVGGSVKAGKGLGSQFWLGGALDVGMVFLDVEHLSSTLAGLLVFPRIVMDVLLTTTRLAVVGLHCSFGPELVPYFSGKQNVSGDPTKTEGWYIRLNLNVGLTVGW